MAHRKGRSKQARTYIHPRQQRMVDVSWRDYLPEDVGTIILSALDAGRGVFIGVTPSKELLTLRIYGESGYTPLYGRSLGELVGRLRKVAGSPRKIERREVFTHSPPVSAPSDADVAALMALWDYPQDLAQQLTEDHRSRLAWMDSRPPLRQRLATCRKSPPPLN